MTQENIENIIKMRMAVYEAGIDSGIWNDINQFGASEMMDYLFPKSGHIAYYNLILEYMRKEHNMIIGGMYTLFKMPIQVEKEIMDFLKKGYLDYKIMLPDHNAYLSSMNTITTDYSLDAVNIGSFNINEIDSILRLCASHYIYSFKHGIKAFPYFE